MSATLSKRTAELSVAVVTAGLLSLSASAAPAQVNGRFQVKKQRTLKVIDVKIQRTESHLKKLQGYKACVEKSNNFKELNECKVKFSFYHHHNHNHHHHKPKREINR